MLAHVEDHMINICYGIDTIFLLAIYSISSCYSFCLAGRSLLSAQSQPNTELYFEQTGMRAVIRWIHSYRLAAARFKVESKGVTEKHYLILISHCSNQIIKTSSSQPRRSFSHLKNPLGRGPIKCQMRFESSFVFSHVS